jgi:hypothetical protein
VAGLNPDPVPVPIPARPSNPPRLAQHQVNTPDETLVHLFFDCDVTQDVLKNLTKNFVC